MMSKRFDIKATLYYRVHDSELYGCPGSIGYAAQSFDHCSNPENCDDAMAESCRASMADMLRVPAEKLDLMTAEEYEAEAGDADEEGDEDGEL